MTKKLEVCSAVLFIGVLAFLIAGFEVAAACQCMQAKNWQQVPGKITKSKIHSHTGLGSRRRSTDFHFDYRYSYNGQSYQGDQVNHGSVEGMLSYYILYNYPRGKQVVVYVNPDNPKDSVLEPEFKTSAAVIFGASVMAFILACSTPWWLEGVGFGSTQEDQFRSSENLREVEEEEEFDYKAYAASLSGR